MTQPKENHKNSCPISMSQRGEWAASVPAECNCQPKENWEEIKQKLYFSEHQDCVLTGEKLLTIEQAAKEEALAQHQDCIPRERVEKVISRKIKSEEDARTDLILSELRQELLGEKEK